MFVEHESSLMQITFWKAWFCKRDSICGTKCALIHSPDKDHTIERLEHWARVGPGDSLILPCSLSVVLSRFCILLLRKKT